MKNLFYSLSAVILLASCAGNPEGTKADTKEAGTVASGGSETFTIDPNASSVAWLGKKVSGAHDGAIKISSGELKVEGGNIVSGNFNIDMNSITNNDLTDPEYNGKLVGHLKADDFFAADKYPTSKFEITEVKNASEGKVTISGNLTIRETTKNITFDANVTENTADRIAADADFNINRKDWGVAYEGMKDDLISDEINFKVKLIAVK